jgi:riboflavin kinase/FMN adenylyltransferase
MIVGTRREELAAVEGPLALTIGVFDGFHLGHRAVFELLRREARAHAAFSLVATFDPHPLEVLRPAETPPLLTTPRERVHFFERSHIDGALVVPFGRETAALSPEEFLDAVTPPRARLAALVIGFDFRMGKGRSAGFAELEEIGRARGFRVVRAEPRANDGDPISSTRIRALLREGRAREAAALLGHPYWIEGVVVPGRGVGRTLEFPTANIDVKDPRKLLPGNGVYAVRVTLLDRGAESLLPGVMNVGTRPTFGLQDRVVEVHLPAFSGDLVGARLGVDLVERIREERRFPSPDALKARIAEDVAAARKILQEA